jgi:MerR family Zn(II)-responsive transcriptional regulator of zntA
MMTASMLKIGEIAGQAGVSVDALRYYEKQGLLKAGFRSEAGYRLYSEADLARLRFIISAKDVGFTLKEVLELLELEVTRDRASCEEVKQLVDSKLTKVESRISELGRIRASLRTLSDACCGGAEPATHCTILDALSERDEEL